MAVWETRVRSHCGDRSTLCPQPSRLHPPARGRPRYLSIASRRQRNLSTFYPPFSLPVIRDPYLALSIQFARLTFSTFDLLFSVPPCATPYPLNACRYRGREEALRDNSIREIMELQTDEHIRRSDNFVHNLCWSPSHDYCDDELLI